MPQELPNVVLGPGQTVVVITAKGPIVNTDRKTRTRTRVTDPGTYVPPVVEPPTPPTTPPPTGYPPVPDGLASGAITLQQAIDRATAPFSVPPRGYSGCVTIPKDGTDITFMPGAILTGTPSNPLFAGVIDFRGRRGVILRGPHVVATTGAGIYGSDSADVQLRDVDASGGTTGITLLRVTGMVAGGRLHDNITMVPVNGQPDNIGYHSGGMKFVECKGLNVVGVEAVGNRGPGIWADGRCDGSIVQGCEAHDNGGAGIFIEITDGLPVKSNAAYRNGGKVADFPPIWAAGILVASCRNVAVTGNISAANAGGDIALISQVRTDDPEPHDLITVTGNVITKPVVQFAEPGAPSTPVTTPNEVVSVDDPRIKALLG